jgi:hypothetical protein
VAVLVSLCDYSASVDVSVVDRQRPGKVVLNRSFSVCRFHSDQRNGNVAIPVGPVRLSVRNGGMSVVSGELLARFDAMAMQDPKPIKQR